MRCHRAIATLATVLICLCCNIHHTVLASTTTWTNASGDGLWGNPANWSDGIPTASTIARLFPTGGTISLGSLTWEAAGVGGGTSPPATLDAGTILTDKLSIIGINANVGPLGNSLVLDRVTFFGGGIVRRTPGQPFDIFARAEFQQSSAHVDRTTVVESLKLVDRGAMPAVSQIVNSHGTLSVDATAYPNPWDRLPDAGELVLEGGTFTWVSSSALLENLGTLALGPGNSYIQLRSSGQPLDFTAGAVRADEGGTFVLNLDASSRFRLGSPPAPSSDPSPTRRTIVPYVIVKPASGSGVFTDLTTYDTGLDPQNPADDIGLRPLTSSEYAAVLDPGSNVRLSGAQSPVGSDIALRSLSLSTAQLPLNGAQITIDSGALVVTSGVSSFGSSIGGTGTLSFPGDAFVYADFGTGTIDVPVSASRLVKSGSKTLTLSKPNTFPAGVVVNSGTLISRASGALGGGPVTLAGGALQIENQSQSITGLRAVNGWYQPGIGGAWTGSPITVGSGAELVVSGPINGAGAIAKLGPGRLHITEDAVVDVSGFTLFAGELQFDGSLHLTLPVPAIRLSQNGGTLSGTGSLQGMTFSRSGVVSPGPGIGRLTFEILYFTTDTLFSTPILQMQLAGDATAGVDYDQLRVLSELTLGGALLDVAIEYPAVVGDVFTIIDLQSNASVNGAFANLPDGAQFTSGPYTLQISYVGGDGNDVTLRVVPEPIAGGPLALGAIALWRRRRG